MWVWTCECSYHRAQKRASDPLELWLERVVCYLYGCEELNSVPPWEQYVLLEPSLQSLATHTKFIDKIYRQLRGTLFMNFHSMLMIKFSKKCKELVLPETGVTRLYTSTDPTACDKCLVTNKGKKIFIFWASTEVKSQPFHSLNDCTHSLRSSFKLVRKGGGWSLSSPNFYYWLKSCSCV